MDLGTASEAEEGGEDEEGSAVRANMTKEEIEAEEQVKTAMERFASGVDEDAREQEALKINDKELDITDF